MKIGSRRRALGLDLITVLGGIGLVVAAALVGWALIDSGSNLFLFWPPLLAWWSPHVDPWTVPVVAVALAVVAYGPVLAARVRWRPLLIGAYVTSFAWTCCLALVNGYPKGVGSQLSDHHSYLPDIPRVSSIPAMLRHFSEHILTSQPDPWTTHVGAHPPGAFLIFVILDRIGLGGGVAGGFFVILIGSSAAVAVVVALRALASDEAARRALPFAVLFPGAVWVGVSADGMFAAVLAWGVALLAVGSGGGRNTGSGGGRNTGAAGRGVRADVAALCGGLLLGYTLYLSYGLALGGLFVLALVALTRRWRALAFAVGGAAVVVVAFTAAGFWWFTGYADTKVIYDLSVAKHRPYWYFVWADIAAFCFAIGPATLAGLRRLTASPRAQVAIGALALAAVLAVVASDLSGMSKAEVERIWLPFAVWLLPACALLPRTQVRAWLAAQAVLTLLVDHLLFTAW